MRADALGRKVGDVALTPALDRLAARGTRFTHAFTTHPKCTPSRCAFLTGMYPHVGGHRTLDLPLRPEEPNFARHLREQGYQTVLVGKNHVTDPEATELTFDHHFRPGGDPFPPHDPDFPLGSYMHEPDLREREAHTDSRATERALHWLGEERDTERPFFLWVNWNVPHAPYTATTPFRGSLDRAAIEPFPDDPGHGKPPYQARLRETYGVDRMTSDQWRELTATYYEMVRMADDEAGRLLDGITRLGLDENTIILFWSDHGDFAGEHQLPEKWDTSFYDGIVRIPFLLAGPGVPEGVSSDTLVESIDLLPTALDIAGVGVPRGIQGRSFAPLLRGEPQNERATVLCQGGQEPELLARTVPADSRPRPCPAYLEKQRALEREPTINLRAKMVRGRRYKYCYHLGGFEELYDLETDPHELHNLAPDPAQAPLLAEQRMAMIEHLVAADTCHPYQDYLES